MTVPNPNGANASVSDPREQTCWDNYVARGLENAYQSALDAGYGDDSAKNITLRDWFKERLGRLKRKDMLSKAERVLDKTLSYSTEDEEGKVKVDLLRVQADVAKTVVTTLGKNEGYSTRSELTGRDGKDLPTPILGYVPTDNNTIQTEEANKED